MRKDKKLSLHKDTLRNLNPAELDQAGGGDLFPTTTVFTTTRFTTTLRFTRAPLMCVRTLHACPTTTLL